MLKSQTRTGAVQRRGRAQPGQSSSSTPCVKPMQKIRFQSDSSFIPLAQNASRPPGALFPGVPGSIFKISSIPSIYLACAIGTAKGMARGRFTYHRLSTDPGMVSAMEGPMNCWGREPRVAEILADPIVEALMAADGVDLQQLLVSLRKTASKVVQLTQGRESGETS